MFIIRGTRRQEKKLGHVAEFCPLCREVRVFDFYRIGLATHIYYVAVGEGKLGGHLLRCTVCRTPYSADPQRYPAIETREPYDLEALIETSFPRLRQAYAERLAIEERLRSSSSTLSAEERASYILEPFRLVNLDLELRYQRETEFDRPTRIGAVVTILATLSLLAIGNALPRHRGEDFFVAAGAALSVGAVYTLVQLAVAPSRYVRQRIIPRVARALAPLQPARVELQACLTLCRGMGLKIGQKLKLPALWSELERLQSKAGKPAKLRKDAEEFVPTN